ncbi:MAG: septal ring lytic transglycosylase RlpA family protein [Hyphomicrobiaceae bacterium]
MIRARLLSVILAVVCCSSPGKAEDAGGAQHQRVSSWHTTVQPEGGSARRIATAALQDKGQAGAVTSAIAVGPTAPSTNAARRGPISHPLSGIASFYWQEQKTASGEPFDKTAMTAAHPTLPFNTRVKVTHLASQRSVVVRINDRGPFKTGRIIDLSHAAAGVLGMHGQGLAKVHLEVVQ